MRHVVHLMHGAVVAALLLCPLDSSAAISGVSVPQRTSTAQPSCVAAIENTMWSAAAGSAPTKPQVCSCNTTGAGCHWTTAVTQYQPIIYLPATGLLTGAGVLNNAGYVVPPGQSVTFTGAAFLVQITGSGGSSVITWIVSESPAFTNTCTFTGPACNATADIQFAAPTGTCTFAAGAKLLATNPGTTDCSVKPTIAGGVQFMGYFN